MISRGTVAIVMLMATAAGHPVLGQDTHVLVITGLGGDPEFREKFSEWGGALVEAASEKFAIPVANIIYLSEDPATDPRIKGRSTRENVAEAFTTLASNSQPGDYIFVVLIGHGSYTNEESRFNLPGPDLTAKDFGLHLDQLSERRVAFANLASASGEFVKALSGAERAIVTATRTGRERNETIFGGYFIDAFSGESADLNRDGRVSLWEAFEFARTEVTREYATSNRIATEHAVLDDNGDGEGSTELEDAADGALARTMFLAADPTLAAARATDDPELKALFEQRAELEQRLEELRALRGQIDQDRYENDLEEVLVELALLNREIQARSRLDQAVSDLRAGAYESAIEALGEISRSDPGPDLSQGDRRRAYVAYLSALAEVGRYEDALEAVSQAPPAITTELANTAGEIFYELGQIDRAREEFARSIQGGAMDRNSARLNLAVIEWRYGDRDAAFAAFDSFIDLYNGSTPLSSADLTAVATAVQYLGIREHELFQDALRAYDEAIAADPGSLEPRVLIGELFLDKYNGPEADAAMKEVLGRNPNHPRALLGLARAMKFNGTVGVMDQVEAALEQNENFTAARVFKARLHLEVEAHDDARAELERALEVNPVSLEALSVLAASHYLRGENGEYRRIRDQVTALSPTYAELYNDVADLSVQSRKYVEAARLAAEAIALDSLSWRAYGILGMNQLRLGLIPEGRSSLETAFEGDPYSVWFYNTLDLLGGLRSPGGALRRIRAAAAHPNRGLSEPRRLFGPNRGTSGHGRSRRHIRKSSRHGLARRPSRRRVQLGICPLARTRPRLPPRYHRARGPALVLRGLGRARTASGP
jgi:tetratricopeptide (TPR) repeat protein